MSVEQRFLQVYDRDGILDREKSKLFPISWIAVCPDSMDQIQHEFGELFISTFFSVQKKNESYIALELNNSSSSSSTKVDGNLCQFYYNSSLLRVHYEKNRVALKVIVQGNVSHSASSELCSRKTEWELIPDLANPFLFILICTSRYNRQHYTSATKVFYHVSLVNAREFYLRCITGFGEKLPLETEIYTDSEYSFGYHSHCQFDFRNPLEIVCVDDLLIVSIAHRDSETGMVIHCHDVRQNIRWKIYALCGSGSFFDQSKFERRKISPDCCWTAAGAVAYIDFNVVLQTRNESTHANCPIAKCEQWCTVRSGYNGCKVILFVECPIHKKVCVDCTVQFDLCHECDKKPTKP